MSPPLPLRDIQLPPEPSWWPPAPGWWVLAGVLLILVALLVGSAIRRWQASRRTQQRLRWLEEALASAGTDPARQLAAMSELLRRLARRDAPQALLLRGEEWLRFLDGDLAGQPFSTGPGRLLLDGGYRSTIAGEDRAAVEALVRQRIEKGLP